MEGTILIHHGIKGQKWGVRRFQNEDGSLTDAGKKRYGVEGDGPSYSDEQYKRDVDVYGKSGANRINRRMIKGASVSGARSKEADRIESFRKGARVAGHVGSVVGTVGGAVAAYFVGKNIVPKVVESITGSGDSATTLIASAGVGMGLGAAGKALGKIGGESLAMLAGGYSPSKKR